MRIGKVKATMLQRSVLKAVTAKGPDGSPAYGEDAGTLALFPDKCDSESERIAIQVNPVEGWTFAAQRAIYGAVNSLAAANATPQAVAISILMPPSVKEKQLKVLMNELNQLCKQENIALIAGHTAYSSHVDTLILSVTGIGSMKEKKLAKKMTGGLDLLVVGHVASEGAARIAMEKEDELKTRFMEAYVWQVQNLYACPSCLAAAKKLHEEQAIYMHDLHEGGIFAGLWEMASAGDVGLDIQLKQIPIKQHAIEVCEYYNLNPYMLYSGGCLLAAVENGSDMVSLLAEMGISATVIGQTTEGHDRIVRYDDETRYLEPPKPDEYFKVP